MWGVTHPSGAVTKVGWTEIGVEIFELRGPSANKHPLRPQAGGSETFTDNGGINNAAVTGHLTEDVVRLGLNYTFGH